MNILDVMGREDLMKPPDIRDNRNYGGYNLTAYFIKQHGKAMGRFGGRWSREVVERYLNEFFEQEERKRIDRRAAAERTRALAEEAVAHARTLSTGKAAKIGEIQGQGGRRAA